MRKRQMRSQKTGQAEENKERRNGAVEEGTLAA